MKLRMCDWAGRWLGEIDPVAIKAAGVDGVWLKACGAAATATTPVDPFHIDPFFMKNVKKLNEYNLNPDNKKLIPGAFSYLVHGFVGAQAALLAELVINSIGYGANIKLDIEDPTITGEDLKEWFNFFNPLWGARPAIVIYTQKNKWIQLGLPDFTFRDGVMWEEAHWVQENMRGLPIKEAERGIYPDWWDLDYAGIQQADGIQFTDQLQVGTRKTTCTLYWDGSRLR